MLKVEMVGLDNYIESMDKFVKYNPTVTRISINDVARKSRTASLKVTREDWNIKARDLKEGSKFIPASNKDLSAEFSMKTNSMSLMKFSKSTNQYVSATTPTGKKRKGGAGVKYKLKKKKGFDTLNKAFVKKSKFNNDDVIFTKRKSPTGASITAQYSITPSSMFKQEGVDVFIKTFMDNYEKEYKRQLLRLTSL